MEILDLVEVYVAHDPVEVTVVVGLLESAGLDVRVRDLTISPYPVAIGPLAEKRIAVERSQEEEANRIIREAVQDGFLGAASRGTDVSAPETSGRPKPAPAPRDCGREPQLRKEPDHE